MANFNSKFNSNLSMDQLTAQIQKGQVELINMAKLKQFRCEHKNNKGPWLKDLNSMEQTRPNGVPVTEDDMKCTNCKDIMSTEVMDPMDIHRACSVIHDAFNQIKLFVKLTEDEKSEIVTSLQTVDEIDRVLPELYKTEVIDAYWGKKKGNNGGSNYSSSNGKGKINFDKINGYKR